MKFITLFLALFALAMGYSQSIIPKPISISVESGSQTINSTNTIFYSDNEFEDIAQLLKTEIQRCHGINLNVAFGATAAAGDIIINKNSTLNKEQYKLEVDSAIVLEVGSIEGAFPGTVSIVQSIKTTNGTAEIAKMKVEDEPYKDFRAVMIDVKNYWYSPDNIKRFIKLARFYKIKYLSLHTGEKQWIGAVLNQTANFSDKQRMDQFLYTKAEMDDLIQFGKANGVYLFPHNESTPKFKHMKDAMQLDFNPNDTFAGYADELDGGGSFDSFDGEENNTRFRNVVVEAHKRAIDQFSAGYPEGQKMPMYHIGPVISEGGMSDDLADYFRGQLIAKDANIKMSYWAGPNTTRGPLSNHKEDLIPICYTKQFHPSFDAHLSDGWNIVNAAWTPLYIVGSNIARPVSMVYNDWNYFRGGTDGLDGNPITFSEFSGINDTNMLGGLMCTWENKANLNFVYLRDRLPAFSEHAWHHKSWPYPNGDFENFEDRLEVTKKIGDLFVSTSDAPAAPKNLAATDDLFSDKIRITWNVADNGPTEYTLYRNNRNNVNSATSIATLEGDVIEYEDTDVTTDQTYYYWLKAKNNFGESDFSFSNSGRSSNSGNGLVKAYESFDYPAGQNISEASGGEGWEGNWVIDFEKNNAIATVNDFGLEYSNLKTSGKSLNLNVISEQPAFQMTRKTKGQIGSEGVSTWISFIIKANKVANGHFALYPNDEFLLGLIKKFGNGFLNTTIANDQTYFVVYEIEASSNNDVARYWVNPDLSVIPSPSNVSSQILDKDAEVGNKITIELQGWGVGNYDIDEIRVGSSFQDVMPPINSTLSVSDFSSDLEKTISVSPNPIDNKVSVKVNNATNYTTATLYTLKGARVTQQLFNGKSEMDINDLETLASGLYILKLEGEKGSITKKLIKQ